MSARTAPVIVELNRRSTIEDNIVTLAADTRVTRWRVPKGCEYIALEYRPQGRAILTVGTLRAMKMQIVGPRDVIVALREAVL